MMGGFTEDSINHLVSITKNCPYNIWRYFLAVKIEAVKIEIFIGKYLIFFLFLLKT